jgi:hypothetical protein
MGIHPHLESGAAPQSALAPLAPLFSDKKINNGKIWGVSPTFRHLTRLESTTLFLEHRQNASNYF